MDFVHVEDPDAEMKYRRPTTFCSQCGTQSDDGAVFCRNCGRRIEAIAPGQVGAISSSPAPTTYNAPPNPMTNYGLAGADPFPSPTSYNAPPNQTSGYAQSGSGPYASAPQQPDYAQSGSMPYYPQQQPALPPSTRSALPKRRLWIAVIAALVVIIIAFAGYTYFNRSTPEKTLDTLCSSLKSGDYQTAYNQFSSSRNFLQGEAAAQFAVATARNFTRHGGMTSCSVSNVTENGSLATGKVVINYGNHHVETDNTTLGDENGVWKITNIKTV